MKSASNEQYRAQFNAANESGLRHFVGEIGHLHYAQYILSRIQPKHGAKVLDVGCGDGAILAVLKKYTPTWNAPGLILPTLKSPKPKANTALNFPPFDFKRLISWKEMAGQFFQLRYHLLIQCCAIFLFRGFLRSSAIFEPKAGQHGVIAHLSIPDLDKRYLLFQDCFINHSQSNKILYFLNLLKMLLMELKLRCQNNTRYADAYFHNPAKLMRALHSSYNCQILRRSDSWYRFDLILKILS